MSDGQSWWVVGPLHDRLTVSAEDGQPRFRRLDPRQTDPRTAASKANARLILHRTAVALIRTSQQTGDQWMDKLDDKPILTWAVETNLGQQRGDTLSAELAARRAKALRVLAADRNAQVLTIEIEPQGALIIGTGATGIRNVGIELDGTHGWPVIPATSLKGVDAAYAEDQAAQPDCERIFGAPRPGSATVPSQPPAGESDQAGESEPAARPGSVLFFDALPGRGGVTVAEHVLTPHVRDYHTGVRDEGARRAPGEYLNPVPIPFLVVDGGTFTAHLLGPDDDVRVAAELLKSGMEDIGVGAKTSAGYGYLTATAEPAR